MLKSSVYTFLPNNKGISGSLILLDISCHTSQLFIIDNVPPLVIPVNFN